MRRALIALTPLLVLAACGETPTGPAPAPRLEVEGLPVFPDPAGLAPEPSPGVPVESPDAAPTSPQTPLGATATLLGPRHEPTSIRFTFDRPVRTDAGTTGDGADPLAGFSLSVTPKHGMKARWSRPDTLVLTPETPWPAATDFAISLESLESATTKLAGPVRVDFTAKPLVLWSRAASLMYPDSLGSDRTIQLSWNQAVPAPPSGLIALVEAPSKADLLAGRTTPVGLTIVADEPSQRLQLLMDHAPRTGHWYRLSVSGQIRGHGPRPLGVEFVSVLRGPEPFAVTGVSCGWPHCTTEDRWTISFNAEPDARSLAGCFTVKPALELGTPQVEGWSVVLSPRDHRPGTSYTLTASTRCRDTLGQRLSAASTHTLQVVAPRPRLGMVTGSGYLAPVQGRETTLDVRAANTPTLRVAMRRITRDELGPFLAAHLQDWGGFDFSEADPGEARSIPVAAEGDTRIPLERSLVGGRGLVFARVQTTGELKDEDPEVREALVQVTELGLMAKSGPQDTLVWVTSLLDRAPMGGVVVEMRKRDGGLLWTRTTDERGLAVGPGNASDAEEPQAGRIVIAHRGDDAAFLDLQRWQDRSDPYDFGLPYVWNPKSDLLRGQVFTERGVYRAGEKVFIKGLVRLDRGRDLEQVPSRQVRVRVTDPLGNRVLAVEAELGAYGDFDLELPLDASAPLGTWRIESEAGELEARPEGPARVNGTVSGSFRVEAYRPNTFEVKVDKARLDGERLVAEAIGRYYAGTPMVGAPARWWVTAGRARFTPKGYEGFVFESLDGDSSWWQPSETSVAVSASGEGTLDDEGRLAIATGLGEALKKALESGPKELLIEAEVTDVDEQTVAGRASLRVESADVYLGLKPSTRFASVKQEVEVELVSLTPSGELAEPASATLRWFKRRWIHELRPSAGGGQTWVSEYKDELVGEQRPVGLGKGKQSLSFTIPEAGSYLVELSGHDAKGRKVAARTHVWAWGAGASWAENDAGRLKLIAAREVWKIGETAQFIVQSPFDEARALVTVERSGVIVRRVVDVTGSAPLIEVPVTEDMVPNVYVSVALLGVPRTGPGEPSRPAEARLGYARLQVDTAERRLKVGVRPDAPDHRPGEKVTVTVTLEDSAGRPSAGQVTFMAVDEGVLALTGYRTPDPHVAMYAERPLSVTTSDARRSLWQRLTRDEGMKSDWGGGGEGGEPENYRAAFATTAAFLPRVEVPESGSAELSFELPDNLTRFRLMAVAVTRDGRFGRGESQVEVNKPLMIRPALPRFLSVGDEFDARAVVTRLAGGDDGPLEVELLVSGPVALVASSTATLPASSAATPVSFRVRATHPGEARFRFAVRQGQALSDAFEVPVQVQWPAVARRTVKTGALLGELTREAHRFVMPQGVRGDVGGLTVTVATSRMNELLPSLDYLLEYPYGCVEQTTGGTLPLLALIELQRGVALPGIAPDEVLAKAQAGLDRLRTMQTWSGGLGYWPGQANPHPWGSAYAGLALVTASRIEGLTVPSGALEKLTGYLRDILRGQAAAGQEEWREELDAVKPLAAWVLALAGQPEASFHAQLFEQRKNLPDFGRLLLALAIAEARGEPGMVSAILDEIRPKIQVDANEARLQREGDRYWGSTMDSDVRSNALLVMALDRLAPEDPLLGRLVSGLLAERRDGHWGNTQDNAFGVLALARHFARTESGTGPSLVRVFLGGEAILEHRFEGRDFAPRSVTIPMAKLGSSSGKPLELVREGTTLPLYWSLRFDHAPSEIPRQPTAHGFRLERSYVFASGPRAGQPVDEVAAGDLIKVELTLENDLAQRYVAIDDPLPAGLEPIQLSFESTSSALGAIGSDPSDEYDRWRPQTFNHTEQRDDRVNLFADHLPRGTHTHAYLARATTRGSFIAPAARVHAMYTPSVSGQSEARDFVIR